MTLSTWDHYFFNWLADLKITPSLAASMHKETPCQHSPTFEEDKGYFDCMRMMTLQKVVAPFLLGFLEIETGDNEEAIVTLDYIHDMVLYLEDKIYMEDYMGGLNYLTRLINHHFFMGPTEWAEETKQDPNFDIGKKVEDFAELGPKSKSIFSIAHWMTNESIRDRKEESVENLKEVRNKFTLFLFMINCKFTFVNLADD